MALSVTLLATFAGGCASVENRQPIMLESTAAGTTAHVHGIPARLRDDLQRSAQRMHWGVIRHRTEGAVPVDELSRVGGEDLVAANTGEAPALIYLEAMLPDGRHAAIFAKPEEKNLNTVVIQVGRFGDAPLERAYIQMLSKTLAGKPKPVRDAAFRLPEGWPSTPSSHTKSSGSLE